MSAAVRVRPAEPADAAAWAAMRAALWPHLSREEHAAEIAEFFAGAADEPQAVLVAVDPDRGQPVGFAELSLRVYAEGCDTSPVGYLEGWYVEGPWRGRRIGGALVAAAEAWARAQGCRQFASDTELANEASAAAHRALGFEEVGIVRCFRKVL